MSRPRPNSRRSAVPVVVVVLAALLLCPAAAQAVSVVRSPAISPAAEPKREGQVLTADDGAYEYEDLGTASTARSWLRCDLAGANCTVVSDAPTYTLVADDVGFSIRLRVAASCANCATTTAESAPTGRIRTDPANEVPPAIVGELQLGEPLELFTGEWSGTQPILIGVQWQRCRTLLPESCVNIPGATEDFYVPRASDLNNRLRAVVTADNARPGSSTSTTSFTEPLRAGLLSPFPLVAIGGQLDPPGARLTLLRVRGPAGAFASVRCLGRTCPLRRAGRTIGVERRVLFRKFERTLAAGTKLVVTVTRPGTIGKYVRFRIRRRRAPARYDACLVPGSRSPRACPAG